MILNQTEAAPASYPEVTGLSDEAQALNADALWQRIEQWIAYRWPERSVTWIVQGPGDWLPPLAPYSLDTAERWTGSAYESVTLDPAPLGLRLDAEAYRLTATVGSADDPPAAVIEAFTRLAEYLADDADMGRVVNSQSIDLGNALRTETERPTAWLPKALQYSGAADLLRPYRQP